MLQLGYKGILWIHCSECFMRIINCFECTTVVTIMRNISNTNTGGPILHIHIWDTMLARKECFRIFMTKSNQVCTKYLLKCIQQFLYDRHTRTVSRNFYPGPPPPPLPLKRCCPTSHCKTFFILLSPRFYSFFKINKIRPPVSPINGF